MGWPINSRPGDEVMLDVPTDILCSYFYFGQIDMSAIASWGTRIIGDSGAFSALTGGTTVDRDEFHAWAARWREDLFWVASLDVIGDNKATQGNWKASLRDGLHLVPTIHYGQPAEAIDYYADQGVDFMGLGGMVPYASEPDRLMRWLIPIFRRARDRYPDLRFHGWGASHPVLLDNLPWWSCDSSGFAAAFRFGTMRLFDPRYGKFVQVGLNGRDIARHRDLLTRHYGLTDWRFIARSTPESRREVGRVAIKAMQLYAHWLQARQGVTPPPSLAARMAVDGLEAMDARGPVSAAAYGRDTSMASSVNPDTTAARRGPLSAAAMGSPQMQPAKAIAPDNQGPLSAVVAGKGSAPQLVAMNPDAVVMPEGPLSAVAAGGNSSPQMQVLDPDHHSMRTKAGPLQAAAAGRASSTQMQAIDPDNRSTNRQEP